MTHTHPVRSGYLAALAKAANESLWTLQTFAQEKKLVADGGYLSVFESTNKDRKWLTVQIGDVPDESVSKLTMSCEARARLLCQLPHARLLAQNRTWHELMSGGLRVEGYVIGFAGFYSLDDPFLIATAYQARLLTKNAVKELAVLSGNSLVGGLFQHITGNSLN